MGYINRERALEALEEHEKTEGHNYSMFRAVVSECAEVIRDLPDADVVERKTGKWIEKEHDVPLARDDSPSPADVYDEESHSIKQKWWHCSECGYEADRFTHPSWNYCPNCGADMRNN